MHFGVVICVLIVLNVIVTAGVLRDRGLSPLQKTGQSALVWLLPLAGACVVLVFLGHNNTRAEMRSLVPPPFHMLGYERREREYHDPPEGSCG